ncbi:MAG: hypothetical protein EOP48_14575 [Sphingobacteriales bacterium]|nr:MAG: hypothetical protein EOP48_14575 [Sphingobacteriales bacterium]
MILQSKRFDKSPLKDDSLKGYHVFSMRSYNNEVAATSKYYAFATETGTRFKYENTLDRV